MNLKHSIIKIVNKLPHVRGLHQAYANFQKNALYPAGHFYSPIISVDDIKQREGAIWESRDKDGITGIDLRTQEQLALLKELSAYYADIPWAAEKKAGLRYQFQNDFYLYTDGIILYSFLRHIKPKRIIEIGSGFSSAVMLDTNELFFQHGIDLTFVEPYPGRLLSLLSDTDKQRVTIVEAFVQAVPLATYDQLEAGDILFVDSTHVVKTGSDVNHILFEILPRLKPGVFIHFHDVFYPFEYPKDWVFGGFNWNEDYFLKAFLLYNNAFKIRLFSEYLHKHHSDAFRDMPLAYKNHGGNLWLQKNNAL